MGEFTAKQIGNFINANKTQAARPRLMQGL